MSLDLQNTAGTFPNGTEYPASPQGLLNLFAQYLAITGGADFIPVNFGSATPGSDKRGYPWFKTDGSGNPLGWYSWNGASWVLMPNQQTTGNTASRPTGVGTGRMYYDTDIRRLLMYDGTYGGWVTADGGFGEVRMVRECYIGGVLVGSPTINQVLTANPGWSQFTDASGRVIGAAGAGSGLTVRALGDTVGVESVALAEAELPSHSHTVVGSQKCKADGNVADAAGILASSSTTNSGGTGSGTAHQNMQPSLFAWCIIKR